MMSSSVDTVENMEHVLVAEIKDFPHFVHLDAPGVTGERLRGLLENLEEESDSDDICPEETISKLNFTSWVYARMDKYTEALEANERVVSMTNWENIVSVGNRVFLSWRAGRTTEVRDCLSKLKKMKALPDFNKRLAVAKAELGYSYSRIGGPKNLFKAIQLLEEFVHKYPQEMYWKLRLGLVYRRCTHFNIFSGMPKGHSHKECIEKSVTYLTDVAEKSANNKLRGPAYSELAVLCNAVWSKLSPGDRAKLFKNKTSNDLCKDALKYGEDSTWVMTSCAKISSAESVKILERCLRVKKHTTTHHQLAMCYTWRAKREAKTSKQKGSCQVNELRNVRGQKQPDCQRGFDHSEIDAPLLTLPNKNFEKAKHEYLEAIKMSHNRNVPAIYSLGLLYKMAGQDDKALERFNQIIGGGHEGHLISIVNAYEQAGLCYLQMGQERSAEEKLTKAISLATGVALSCRELYDRAEEVWRSFRTMTRKADVPCVFKDKRLSQLFSLVRKYNKVVKVVEKILSLTDTQLRDPDTIISELISYLKLNEPEKALTFLNMLSTRPDITSSESWRSKAMTDLRYKVLLLTAKYRLQSHSAEARLIFQELFKLCYGHCAEGVPEDQEEDVSSLQDVLLFYDDTERDVSRTKTMRELHDVFSQVFGLSTSRNLQYGPKLEEMKSYRVVVVVLGEEEERDPEYQAMLEKIPSMNLTDSQTTKVLVLDIRQERADVPAVLSDFCYYRIQEAMSDLDRSTQGACSDEGQTSVNEIIRNVVGNNLDALMKLFCFIIGHDWPLADM